MRLGLTVIGLLGFGFLTACSGVPTPSIDDSDDTPTTVAQVQTRAQEAFADPGTLQEMYTSTYPGIAAWAVSVSSTNAVVYTGIDAKGVAKVAFAAVLDPDGSMAGGGARVTSDIQDPQAKVLDAMSDDIDAATTAGTTQARSPSARRTEGVTSALVISACSVAGSMVGKLAGGAAGGAMGAAAGSAVPIVGTAAGAAAGTFAGKTVGGAAGGAAAGYACKLVADNCTHSLVTALKGIGLIIAAGQMGEAGIADSAGMAQQGAQMVCPGAAAASGSSGSGSLTTGGSTGGTSLVGGD